MNKKEREKYKKLLIKEKIRILEAIGALQKGSLELRQVEGENPGIPTHLAELASDNFEKNLDLDLASSEGKLIVEINNALAKLEKKLFGICEECRKKIGKKRLRALPYARLCIACQKKDEGSGLNI
ncbi:MAG: TraR/DksA family transcriptional regulator [Candidatus Omnitrophica bacterium]|nr:TraR/DksA family transcriptional regulator [Candidatus Omnitrophota bacterium]